MRIHAVTLTLALACASQPAAARRPAPDLGGIDRAALEELDATHTPGAAVAVVVGDRVVYAKGFGVASVETRAPVTPDTLFAVASVTKMFTGTAAATLAERGAVRPEQPIGTYVSGLGPRTSRLTLHQLLTHTAGLVDQAPGVAHDDAGLLAGARGWKDGLFFADPGETYSYSNPGFAIAGLALQEAAKKPYADLLQELIFDPVGMKRTTFRTRMAITFPVAVGHDAGAGGRPAVLRPFPENVLGWPNGGMISSANDLARFAVAFMNGGMIDGRQALSPGAIARVATGHVTVPAAAGDWRYGYGARAGEVRGVRVVEHRGGTDGFGSLLRMAPDAKFAVVVLGNRTLAQLDKTAETAMELFLRLGPKPAAPARAPLPLSRDDFRRFPGAYSNGRLTFEVRAKGESLVFSAGGDEVPLVKVGENRLAIAEADPSDPPEVTEMLRNLIFLPNDPGPAKYLNFGGRALKRASP